MLESLPPRAPAEAPAPSDGGAHLSASRRLDSDWTGALLGSNISLATYILVRWYMPPHRHGGSFGRRPSETFSSAWRTPLNVRQCRWEWACRVLHAMQARRKSDDSQRLAHGGWASCHGYPISWNILLLCVATDLLSAICRACAPSTFYPGSCPLTVTAHTTLPPPTLRWP